MCEDEVRCSIRETVLGVSGKREKRLGIASKIDLKETLLRVDIPIAENKRAQVGRLALHIAGGLPSGGSHRENRRLSLRSKLRGVCVKRFGQRGKVHARALQLIIGLELRRCERTSMKQNVATPRYLTVFEVGRRCSRNPNLDDLVERTINVLRVEQHRESVLLFRCVKLGRCGGYGAHGVCKGCRSLNASGLQKMPSPLRVSDGSKALLCDLLPHNGQ